jgi:hypothetical protein
MEEITKAGRLSLALLRCRQLLASKAFALLTELTKVAIVAHRAQTLEAEQVV